MQNFSRALLRALLFLSIGPALAWGSGGRHGGWWNADDGQGDGERRVAGCRSIHGASTGCCGPQEILLPIDWGECEWQGGSYDGGIDARWETLNFTRADAETLVRNGFHSEVTECGVALGSVELGGLRSEGILLGSCADLLFTDGQLLLQILGDWDGGETPCAIRATGHSSPCCPLPWEPYPRILPWCHRGNGIDLGRSVDISYHHSDGSPYAGPGVAIRGNSSTTLDLRNGTAEAPNQLPGIIEGVGKVHVHGRWSIPDGFQDCGHLIIDSAGWLHAGTSRLDVQNIHFHVDSTRSDAYLLCGGLLGTSYLQISFDRDALTNPAAQSYLLIGGLLDADETLGHIRQLNVGKFSYVAEGDAIYVQLAEDEAVGPDSPRPTYYLGLRESPIIIGEGEMPTLSPDEPTQESVRTLNLVKNGLQGSLGCAGDDPFAALIVAHANRRSGDGLEGYRSDIRGLVLGADWARQLASGARLRGGVCGGYLRRTAKYVSGGKLEANTYLLGPFATYSRSDGKGLGTDLIATSGISHCRERLSSLVGERSKFSSADIFADLDVARSLFACRMLRIGPWLDLAYHHLRQNAHSAGTIPMPRLSTNLLNTTLGLRIQCETQQYLHLYANAGWSAQPFRSHSAQLIRDGGDVTLPPAAAGDRHSALITAGFCRHLGSRWALSGSWDGNFSKHYTQNRLTLGLGYEH